MGGLGGNYLGGKGLPRIKVETKATKEILRALTKEKGPSEIITIFEKRSLQIV